MTKFIRLFSQTFYDASMFLLLYGIVLIYFSFSFHLLGAAFDDGDQHSDDYDTDHNDYPHMPYVLVTFVGIVRTSMGDLQPPSYDFWTEIDGHSSQFYIVLIWLNYLACLMLTVIMTLNFLIAIIQQSYESIMEHE